MAYSGGISFAPEVGVDVKCDEDDAVVLVVDHAGNVLYEAEEGE